MDRRTLLARSATGIALLSGAAVPASAAQDADADEVQPPQVNALDEDRWALVDDTTDVHERSLGLTSVTVRERSRVWNDQNLSNRLYVVTRGRLDETVMTFFASRLDIQGLLSGGVRVADIEDVALPEFEERLDDHGLENVRTVPLQEPHPDRGSRANTHEYAAEYPVQGLLDDVEGTGASVELDDGPLEVTGLLTVWLDSGVGYVAGGIFPAETYGTADAEGVDLAFTPDQYRRDVVELVESVA